MWSQTQQRLTSELQTRGSKERWGVYYTINKRTIIAWLLSQKLNKRFWIQSTDDIQSRVQQLKPLHSNMKTTTGNPAYKDPFGVFPVHATMSRSTIARVFTVVIWPRTMGAFTMHTTRTMTYYGCTNSQSRTCVSRLSHCILTIVQTYQISCIWWIVWQSYIDTGIHMYRHTPYTQ